MKWVLLVSLVLMTGCFGPNMDYYGGPGWRVFDVHPVEGVDSPLVLHAMHREVERCMGSEREFKHVRAYTASDIFSLSKEGKLRRVVGLAADEQLYVVRGLDFDDRRGVMMHELGHYIQYGMDHPDIDPLLKACGIPLSMRMPR